MFGFPFVTSLVISMLLVVLFSLILNKGINENSDGLVEDNHDTNMKKNTHHHA